MSGHNKWSTIKQKKGKKRMKQIGNVEVPQKAFLAVLKLD
jgi:GTP-binding protein LepA